MFRKIYFGDGNHSTPARLDVKQLFGNSQKNEKVQCLKFDHKALMLLNKETVQPEMSSIKS